MARYAAAGLLGWLLADIASGAIAGAVMLSLLAALTPIAGETTAAIAGVLTGLATFGITLWMVLRQRFARAGRLALASAVGLVAAATLDGGVIGGGTGFGGVYGAITGGRY